MAARTLPGPRFPARSAADGRLLSSPGALALAASLPLVFLHVNYQPGVNVTVGSTSAHVALSDFLVLAVGAVAALVWLRRRPAPFRPAIWIWISAAALLAWVVAACFYPLLRDDPYAWRTHLVSAGKFVEYALLGLGVVVLVRRRADLGLLLGVLVAWSAAATVVAIAQLFGAGWLDGWGAGRRQPSFLGHHDFAVLSGAAATLALVAIGLPAWRIGRRLGAAAGVAGGLGLVLSGSSAGAIGFVAAAVAAGIVVRLRGASLRHLAAIAGIAAVVGGGVALLRGGDIESFVHFVGVGKKEQASKGVETYTQRTLLSYIGWRIFLDHPVVGVGWGGSSDEAAYRPYLDDARREFPGTPAIAFPSPEHPYGVQNAYVQALADLGAVGTVLFLAPFAAGLLVAARRALRGPPEDAAPALLAGLWLLVAMAVWSAAGLVAGIPLDALTWLALGLVAASAAGFAHGQA